MTRGALKIFQDYFIAIFTKLGSWTAREAGNYMWARRSISKATLIVCCKSVAEESPRVVGEREGDRSRPHFSHESR